ncbi:MAG TPA: flagellar basal body P-ring formation chaperone FlgA [Variovorax sp.]|nr:flagellar basal body P-ring formation chaperone FlgA [Variovorax sp.]
MHYYTLRLHVRRLALAATALAAGAALAGPSAEPLPEASRLAIERLVQTQSKGLPGEISLEIKGGRSLPPCDAPEAFLAPGTQLRGRVSIGLRCVSPAPWKRFVQAYISVQGHYYVAAQPIEAGQPLGAGDVSQRTGDLAALPRSVVTDPAALHGVVAANRIAAGAPLRKELLRSTVVIQQGQTVKVVAQGAGYSVSTEAKAMTRAEVGATVQAKTRDGRLVSGIADEEGQIRLAQ